MSRELKTMQRALAELIRTGRASSDDPYVRQVAASTGLAVTRDCIAAWRELLIRDACPLTARLLERRGELSAAIRELLADECPPYIEYLALAFLRRRFNDRDHLVAAVAQFEAAMIESHRGAPAEVLVRWPAEPRETISRILHGDALDDLPRGEYATVVKPAA